MGALPDITIAQQWASVADGMTRREHRTEDKRSAR
jgi:hypothetical protein